MKIRIYFPTNPYPPTEGAHHVVWEQACALQELGHSVEWVHWKKRNVFESKISRFFRVFLSFFQELTSPELFFYPSHAPTCAVSSPADLGIYHYSFSYAWLKKQKKKRERRQVVYFHNLEHELFEMRARAEGPSLLRALFKKIHFQNAKRLKKHEHELSSLVDELWFLSVRDRESFKIFKQENENKSPAMDVKIFQNFRFVPPVFSKRFSERRLKAFDQKKGTEIILGFLGKLDFLPNFQSLDWILTHVAPLLKENNFGGEFWIGGQPPQSKAQKVALEQKSASFPFVKWKGFIDDLECFWANLSFLLIPQVGGSGTRIKLIESVASKVPVLTNTALLPCLDPELRTSSFLFCSDDPMEWAKVILTSKPMEYRAKLQSIPLPKACQSPLVYSFLDSSFFLKE